MAAHRKYPPKNACVELRLLAAAGSTFVGIAKHFNVSSDTLKRWIDENQELGDSFEQGKDEEREKLHNALSKKALAGDIVACMFLLKSRHKYDDKAGEKANKDVSIAVNIAPVMVVKDLGTDEQWAAKTAERQRKLIQGAGDGPALLSQLAAPVIDVQAVTALPAAQPAADPTAGWQRQNGYRLNPATNAWEPDAPQQTSPALPKSYSAPSWRQNA